jgi:hypothetical protein
MQRGPRRCARGPLGSDQWGRTARSPGGSTREGARCRRARRRWRALSASLCAAHPVFAAEAAVDDFGRLLRLRAVVGERVHLLVLGHLVRERLRQRVLCGVPHFHVGHEPAAERRVGALRPHDGVLARAIALGDGADERVVALLVERGGGVAPDHLPARRVGRRGRAPEHTERAAALDVRLRVPDDVEQGIEAPKRLDHRPNVLVRLWRERTGCRCGAARRRRAPRTT